MLPCLNSPTAYEAGNGGQATYTYDDLYCPVRKKSLIGAVEKYAYDRKDVVTRATDALGNVTCAP